MFVVDESKIVNGTYKGVMRVFSYDNANEIELPWSGQFLVLLRNQFGALPVVDYFEGNRYKLNEAIYHYRGSNVLEFIKVGGTRKTMVLVPLTVQVSAYNMENNGIKGAYIPELEKEIQKVLEVIRNSGTNVTNKEKAFLNNLKFIEKELTDKSNVVFGKVEEVLNEVALVDQESERFLSLVRENERLVDEKYHKFDVSVTTANQTIDDILALQPQFQAVLDETTGKDVISAPEIILARGGEANLKARLDKEKQEVTAQLAQTAVFVGERLPSEQDDTVQLQMAINKAGVIGTNVILTKPVYEVSSTIYLKSNVGLVSFNQSKIQSKGVTDILKTDGSSSYENITLNGITIGGGKVPFDDNIRVCGQFYNVTNLTITNCKLQNGSAGVGLDTCRNVFINNNVIEAMFQQTTSASQAPGTYGYGVTVVECENVWINDNALGRKGINKQIDRHAVYVSTKGQAGNSKNSVNVYVKNNSIVQHIYRVDEDMLTGFEYVLKSISGDNILFEGNTSIGGVGGFMLVAGNVNGGHIIAKNNTFKQLLKTGTLIVAASPSSTYYMKKITLENNYFEMTGGYARGINASNFKELVLKNNEFVSTSNEAVKQMCYHVKQSLEVNGVQAEKFLSYDNRLKGFKRVGDINRVDVFISDDFVEDFPTIEEQWFPYRFFEAVGFKKMRIKFIEETYNFKELTHVGVVGLTYFDSTFNSEITCLSVSPPNWINSKGEQVVCTSKTRPNVSTLYRGYKVWEQDLSRSSYFSGISWETFNKIIPRSGTKAEILAINGGTSYSDISIFNTEDKKPYWWDAHTKKWKDATGTVLI